MILSFRTATGWILCALSLAAQWLSTDAWSPEGHKKIAEVAVEMFKNSGNKGLNSLHKIRGLIGGNLVDFAGFERDTLSKSKITQQSNWHRQNPEWTCDTGLGINGKLYCDGSASDYLSLLCIASDTFNQYTHDALLRDFDATNDPLFPGNSEKKKMEAWIHYLHQEGDGQATKSELRTLQILIGDMHHPLHWHRRYDYGNDVKVSYRGEQYTLRQFWEDYLPKQATMKKQTGKIERGAARYGNFDDRFRKWAKEASEHACKDIFGLVKDPNARLEITDEIYQKWLRLAEVMMETAGHRLAEVIYAILQHKKSKEHEKHGRGFRHDHVRIGKRATTNFFIAIVLVPALLFFFTWHEREGFQIKLFPKIGRFLE